MSKEDREKTNNRAISFFFKKTKPSRHGPKKPQPENCIDQQHDGSSNAKKRDSKDGICREESVRKLKDKTAAEQRDIFRPKMHYNYINLMLKNDNALKNAKKFKEKKASIHLSPF